MIIILKILSNKIHDLTNFIEYKNNELTLIISIFLTIEIFMSLVCIYIPKKAVLS